MPKYLRQTPSGDLYIWTAAYAKRDDMEEVSDKTAAGVKSANTRAAKQAGVPKVTKKKAAKKKATVKETAAVTSKAE